MNQDRAKELLTFYRRQLLDDVIPFWMKHSLDYEFGGYLHCLDRTGRVTSTDKYVWMQGREVWAFSALYNRVEPRQEWLDAAKLGVVFLQKYGRDPEGNWCFHLSRDGQIIEGATSIAADWFVIYGLAEYAKAAHDDEALSTALDSYWHMRARITDPHFTENYPFRSEQPIQWHGTYMIMLEITQELDRISPDPRFRAIIDQSLENILYRFARTQDKALVEAVASDFSKLNAPIGRQVWPGHALESGWMVLHQAQQLKDASIVSRAADIIQWSIDLGWDEEYGGIQSYLQLGGGKPEPWGWFKAVNLDPYAKVFWVHSEALYALMLAHYLTGRQELLNWYDRVHKWTFDHFRDLTYGEWFSYLDRQGQPTDTSKGSIWKTAFHVPRALLLCLMVLEDAMEHPNDYAPVESW